MKIGDLLLVIFTAVLLLLPTALAASRAMRSRQQGKVQPVESEDTGTSLLIRLGGFLLNGLIVLIGTAIAIYFAFTKIPADQGCPALQDVSVIITPALVPFIFAVIMLTAAWYSRVSYAPFLVVGQALMVIFSLFWAYTIIDLVAYRC